MSTRLLHLTSGRPLVLALFLVLGVQMVLGVVAFAFTQSQNTFIPSQSINFTLVGCRNNGGITLPDASGRYICADAAYTSGNLGKFWNELDLVPHRLTTEAGSQAGVTTTYDVYIAAQFQNQGRFGYDVISEPRVNATKSDPSCQVSVGPQSTQVGTSNQGTLVYRQLTISQNPGTTCVFDYYLRLAQGAHLFPGSSLQSYTFTQVGLTGTQQTVSTPVGESRSQLLKKEMTATEGVDPTWNITKSSTVANLSFGNTCDPSQPQSQTIPLTVTWTKGPASPSGQITVTTHVYATNPSARTIITTVADQISFTPSGTTRTEQGSPVPVPANTSNTEVLTRTFTAPSGTTMVNDTATATYTDPVSGLPFPDTATATASALVQTGPVSNTPATIHDSESITGTGLTFSATAAQGGAAGSFDSGYVAGTQTNRPVSWTSVPQTASGL